jgi:anti-anti-sigma regulatory factor
VLPTDNRTVHILKRGSEDVLLLGETPQLDSIHALHEAALSLSQTAAHVVVDCDGVEHLGAWAVQILMALKIALASNGGGLRIAGASPPIHHYLALAGVSEHFPEVSAGGNTCLKQC